MHLSHFHHRAVEKKGERQEQGAALVEFAIVAAGMLFGFLMFIDICYAACNYFTLSGIAAEALRAGGRVPELESKPPTYLPYTDTIISLKPATSSRPTAAEQAACDSGTPTTFWCGQNVMHQRIKTMLDNVELQVVPSSIIYSTNYIPKTAVSPDADTVSVSIEARYRGFILINWPIRVSAQGPYLF